MRAEDTDLLNRLWRDVIQGSREKELAAVRRDPEAHRLTRLMEPGRSFRYRYADGGRDHTGRSVRFCWSTWKNAAGYYLAWKERRGERGQGERVGWTAHKTRKAARSWSERWCREWKVERRRSSTS